MSLGKIIGCRKMADSNRKGFRNARNIDLNIDGYEYSVLLTYEESICYDMYEEGQEIKDIETKLEKIMYGRLMSASVSSVVYSKKTERQVRQKLLGDKTKIAPEYIWQEIYSYSLNRLIAYYKEQGYINDDEYAIAYLRTHISDNVSIDAHRRKLSELGISEEIVAKALLEIQSNEHWQDDYDKAFNALVKNSKIDKQFILSNGKMSDKDNAYAFRHLNGKGFTLDECMKAIKRYEVFICEGANK